MEGIEFENPTYGKPLASTAPKKSWAVQLVRKAGGKYIKSDEQASLVLVGIAILFFILAMYNFISIGSRASASRSEQSKNDALMQAQLNAAKTHGTQ